MRSSGKEGAAPAWMTQASGPVNSSQQQPQQQKQVEEIKESPLTSGSVPLRLLALADSTACFYRVEKDALVQETIFPSYPQAKIAKYAPLNGKIAAIVDDQCIHFVNTETGQETLQIVHPEITVLDFSPADTYVLTCQRFDPKQASKKTMILWDTQQGKEVKSFMWKTTPKDSLQSMKFTSDEQYCFRCTQTPSGSTNAIEIYRDHVFEAPWKTIHSKFHHKAPKKGDPMVVVDGKFDGFQFCPLNPAVPAEQSPFYVFAWQNAAVMSEKDTNGTVYVYDIAGTNQVEKAKFYIQCPRAQEIQIYISSTGHAALIWSQNFNDSSGKSYYGEHTLQYVQIFGGKDRQFVPVFDNQMLDVAWLPNGEAFIVISGMQPSTTTLYDKNCNALFEFGKNFRNTIKICPFSQLAMIGGFGNLAGQVDVWSLKDLNNVEEVGKFKSYCAVSQEWSPNGRDLLTAVLYERVKVDNMVSIFGASGKKILPKGFPFAELHFAQWQPYPKGTFKCPNIKQMIKEAQMEQDKKPKRTFVMPGSGNNSAFSQIMRQEMSKAYDRGPKKLDSATQNQYKEFGKEQKSQASAQVTSYNPSGSKKDERNDPNYNNSYNNNQSIDVQEDLDDLQDQNFGSWRNKGQGGNQQRTPKQQQHQQHQQQQPKTPKQKQQNNNNQQKQKQQQQQNTQAGNIQASVNAVETKVMSKHAKRRANKKKKMLVVQSELYQEEGQQDQQ